MAPLVRPKLGGDVVRSKRGTTYSLSVGGSALMRSYGLPVTYSANNRAAAEKLAQLANQLVPWKPQ